MLIPTRPNNFLCIHVLLAALYPATTYTVAQLPPVPPDNDITNTTVCNLYHLQNLFNFYTGTVLTFLFLSQIFVGCLDPNVTEEELKQICSQFGDIIYVKIPAGKGCGFVQFVAR